MTKLEQLQNELFALRRLRKEVTLEKGIIAEDEKDLRENGAYMIMEEKEHLLTSKIMAITKEIDKLTMKPVKKPIRKNRKEEKVEPIKPQKWY